MKYFRWLIFWLLCSVACAEPESPRLQALDAQDPAAVAKFWTEVETSRSPLIEQVPGHADEALFTFVFRTDAKQVALNVQLNGWFPLHAQQGFDNFTRLKESGIWYCSYTLPRDAQIRYELISPKGWHPAPDRATYFTMDDREYETFRDPLNPRVAHWNDTVTSYAEGPDAKTSPYLEKRAGVPAGTIETLDIPSRFVAGKRPALKIYLPPGYKQNSGRDYGVLLAYDGNQYTTAVPLPMILDNMIAARAIAPVIAVFLESPNRDLEFPPNDDFQKYIGSELIPELRRHYRISRDPRRNTVLGSSYGGLAATYTAFVHPDLFGNVISQSGSYGWSPDVGTGPPFGRGQNPEAAWLVKKIAEAPRKPIRFYLDAGLWEGGGMLASNRMLRAVLTGKGYTAVYREAPGTHHSYYWLLRLPDALASLSGK
jgi:enterochelin esterase-like enzyme